jgi:chondroitin 4-sulfotransferase 11
MGWIVSKKYKFIFIHIPKTGGSSIAEPEYLSGQGALVAHLGSEDHVQAGHIRAVGLKNRLQDNWDDYFKFTFVRNPWDRTVSLYHYFLQDPEKQRSMLGKEIAKLGSFKEFCHQLDNIELDPHFDPQISYLIDYEGHILVDFIGRFETIASDVDFICKKAGLPAIILPHFRKSDHDSYRRYYDNESAGIIATKYKSDIDAFKYTFNSR